MAMLKICTYSHTTWIADVTRVDKVKDFSIKDGESPFEACFQGNPPTNPDAYATAFGETQRDGKLIRVYTKPGRGPGSDRPQLWVIPEGSTYLMEDGRTVDRL